MVVILFGKKLLYIKYIMCDFSSLDHLEPCLYEIDECIREIHDYKLKKRQFLESTGLVELKEESGLIIRKAVVSGLNITQDITDIILLVNTQGDCPQDTLIVDTGKLNEYTGGDIEPGTRKLVEVHYVTEDVTFDEKKLHIKQISQENKVRVYDHEQECEILPDFERGAVSQVYEINKPRIGNLNR